MKDMKNITKYHQNIEKVQREVQAEFAKKMKEEAFAHLVSLISLPQDYLANYTTKFEMSVEELNHCKGCKGLVCCKNKITGYIYYPSVIDDKLIFSYFACRYQKEKIDKEKYLKNVFIFDEPKEIANAKLKDVSLDDRKRIEAIKWITSFPKKYEKDRKQKGLYLYGSFGGGKTYLIAALLNELANKGVKVAMLYYPEFLRTLKGSFDDNYNDKFDRIKKCDLLLLDDIGAETTTGWNRDEILGSILQYRMQEGLTTFFTSNMTLEELEQHFTMTKDHNDKLKARRIMERIKNMTEAIEMVCENRRK